MLDSASSHASSVVEGANKGALASPALVTEDEIADEWDMTTSLKRLGEYVEQHPEFLTAVVFWVLSGNVLLLAGLFIFLFSEIKMVCVVRGRDMRTELLEAQTLNRTAAEHETLTQAEAASVAPRAYLTFLGSVLFFFGVLIALIPLCDVLHLLGKLSAIAQHLWPCMCSRSAWFRTDKHNRAANRSDMYLHSRHGGSYLRHRLDLSSKALYGPARVHGLREFLSRCLCRWCYADRNVLLLLLFLFLSFSIYMIYFNWYRSTWTSRSSRTPPGCSPSGALSAS